MIEKDYSKFKIVDYKGQSYIFDPFSFGTGNWKIYHTKSGKAGISVSKTLNIELNKNIFGTETIPNLLDRIKTLSNEDKENYKQTSKKWLEDKIKGIQTDTFLGNETRTKIFVPGGVYFYFYDAKTKDKLPYWDKFPLTIILELYDDGFLGLNLHYLDESKREKLLGVLSKAFSNVDNKNTIMKFALTYEIFSGLSQFDDMKVCIKKYLYNHVVSRILPIETQDWGYAILLPVQQFQYNTRK